MLIEFVVALCMFLLVIGVVLRLVCDVVGIYSRIAIHMGLVETMCAVVENRGNKRLYVTNDMYVDTVLHKDDEASEYVQQLAGNERGTKKMVVYDVAIHAKNVAVPEVHTMYVEYE